MKTIFTLKKQNPVSILILIITLLSVFDAEAQIKVWNTNKVTIGPAATAPSNNFLGIWGSSYQGPFPATSGFYFENHNYSVGGSMFNEPILKPQWTKSMWLGNANYELYRVFATRIYQSQGASIYSFSDRRLKTNLRVWNESALTKIMNLNAYRYDMDPEKFINSPEGKIEVLTKEAKNKIGFIAQELLTEFPEVVTTVPGTEYLAVDYGMMIPVLLEAIKEQQKLIEELQKNVEELKK
jgi:hypothetical protein